MTSPILRHSNSLKQHVSCFIGMELIKPSQRHGNVNFLRKKEKHFGFFISKTCFQEARVRTSQLINLIMVLINSKLVPNYVPMS